MLTNNNEDISRPEYSAELNKSGTRGKYAKHILFPCSRDCESSLIVAPALLIG